MTLRKRNFENAAGMEENPNNQQLYFSYNVFYYIKDKIIASVTFKMSSANAASLDKFEILLSHLITWNITSFYSKIPTLNNLEKENF